MVFLVAVLLVIVIAGFGAWRVQRHGEPGEPKHQQPLDANADVLAARLERVADNLEAQSAELRAAAAAAKSEQGTT